MAGFNFNKIYVIESLRTKDTKTGEELHRDLLQWKVYSSDVIQAELLIVNSKLDFFESIQKISSVTRIDKYPIIHFEMHGSKEGLQLSNNDFVKWNELYKQLIEINTLSGNNLFITLAVCSGAYLMKLIKPFNPSPFWGIIGSFDILYSGDISIKYQAFYDTLLEGFDLDKAFNRLKLVESGIPSDYRIIRSNQTFINVYSKYLKTQFTPEIIKKRWENGLKETPGKFIDGNDKARKKAQFSAKVLREKKLFFEKHKKIFFLLDRYPENVKNIDFTFEDLHN